MGKREIRKGGVTERGSTRHGAGKQAGRTQVGVRKGRENWKTGGGISDMGEGLIRIAVWRKERWDGKGWGYDLEARL